MQVWRTLLHLVGLSAMIMTSVSVRLLAAGPPAEHTQPVETGRQGRGTRPVIGHDCSRCHPAARSGS